MIIVIASLTHSSPDGGTVTCVPQFSESSILRKWQVACCCGNLVVTNNYCPIMKWCVENIRDQLIGDIRMNRNPCIDKLFQFLFDRNQRPLIRRFTIYWIAVFTWKSWLPASFLHFRIYERRTTDVSNPRRISLENNQPLQLPIESRSS